MPKCIKESKTIKGNITYIKLVRNDLEVILGYEILIETEEPPSIKLGECYITQSKGDTNGRLG